MAKIVIINYQKKYARSTVEIWRRSKEQALGMEDKLHSFDDHLEYLTQHLIQSDKVLLAVDEQLDSVAGIIAFNSSWVNQLYVDISYQGKGIGKRLLSKAIENSSGALYLYTFEVNTKAQSFYERAGFVAIKRGDCDNEEKLPSILYRLEFDSIK